jgi:lipopolysaccharide biosynthesis glycosyltransferase
MESKQTAVEWLSNQAYELFEQYSEGKFDRIQLNKLMVDATNKAKEMEKEQIMLACGVGYKDGILYANGKEWIYETVEQYYNETYKQD